MSKDLPVVTYAFTEYSKTLAPMIDNLIEWPVVRRKEVVHGNK